MSRKGTRDDDERTEKAPLPTAYVAADVEAAITRARAAAQELDTTLASAEAQATQYRAVADRYSDIAREVASGEKTLADLTENVRAARAAHDQEVSEWAQQRSNELRAHAEALEQRRVKMEEDLHKKQLARDEAHAQREAKLGDAEKIARARVAELQDEIRVLDRRREGLQTDVNNLEALKASAREDLAAIRAKIS